MWEKSLSLDNLIPTFQSTLLFLIKENLKVENILSIKAETLFAEMHLFSN